MMKLQTCIVGLGKQGLEYHLPALLECDYAELKCVCDIDSTKVNEVADKYSVKGYTDIVDMIKTNNIDLAIVSVPHSEYFRIISLLAEKGIHILKEKPLALNMKEAVLICELVKKNHIKMMITLQRRYNPIFTSFHQLKKRIGKIYMIDGKYTMNISRLDSGRRSSFESSGGGAIIDMGYHFIDLLIWYFGVPKSLHSDITSGNRENQIYNVEDTVNFGFHYGENNAYDNKTIGNITISRVYPEKQEIFMIYGSKGIIEITRGKIRRLDVDGNQIECLMRDGGRPSAAIEQIDDFALQILEIKPLNQNYLDHLNHMAMIEAIYSSNATGKSVNPSDFLSN